jgi:two-component system chemotaxis response regulator CheB
MRYAAYDLVVIAASRGGVNAIGQVIQGLPADFPAAVIVLLHISHPSSYLREILERYTGLPVTWARGGDPIRPGHILVAPPDRHVLIRTDKCCHVADFERVNYVRPSADILFETAAHACGNRVLGVILTGNGRDGAVGSRAIKNAGGRILVQDRQSSESFDMPCAAVETGAVDFMLPLSQIPAAILSLVAIPGADKLFQVSPDFSFWHVQQSRGIRLTGC